MLKLLPPVEETSTYKFIPEKDLFDVEYWSLEQAKIKKKEKITRRKCRCYYWRHWNYRL